MAMSPLKKYIDEELRQADELVTGGDLSLAFRHLERAHVLGQSRTFEHTRVHWRMLLIGWKRKDWREIFGQMFRIGGASTKTPLGIYPKGNTGGANVNPFKKMPIEKDLQLILESAGNGK
ncbi:MAG: DUF3703 domain-containing protein [Saprospiraceae bacterium]|nr:DUF3703 domain-containing protein [Pyrinomonadaceae bacterium]